MCKEAAAGNLSVGQRANQANMQEQDDTIKELIKSIPCTGFTFDISRSPLTQTQDCSIFQHHKQATRIIKNKRSHTVVLHVKLQERHCKSTSGLNFTKCQFKVNFTVASVYCVIISISDFWLHNFSPLSKHLSVPFYAAKFTFITTQRWRACHW